MKLKYLIQLELCIYIYFSISFIGSTNENIILKFLIISWQIVSYLVHLFILYELLFRLNIYLLKILKVNSFKGMNESEYMKSSLINKLKNSILYNKILEKYDAMDLRKESNMGKLKNHLFVNKMIFFYLVILIIISTFIILIFLIK